MATKKPAVKDCPHGFGKKAYCARCHRDSKPAAPQSSPLPFAHDNGRTSEDGWCISDSSGEAILQMFGPRSRQRQYAALIVRHVNQGPAFDVMVEALAGAIEHLAYILEHHRPAPGGEDRHNWIDIHDSVTEYRAALKLAQEV